MTSVARTILDVLFAGLWQGAFIALVVTGALALAAYRFNAGTRYVILQATLAALVIVPLATTLPTVMSRAFMLRAHAIASSAVSNDRAPGESAVTARRIDVSLSDRTVVTLVSTWLAGVIVLALRIAAGSLQLARLARRSHAVTSRDGVEIFASPDVGIPLAAGFSEPAIILPIALVAQADETFECVVLHELAHVRRGDAYANACERAIHAILYFNPSALLLMRAIALEREIACDDWAIEKSRDVVTYIRSLASFAVGAAGYSVASGAAPGFGHATLTRIHRLEDQRRNGAISLSHYAIGGFTLMLFTIALTLNSFAPAIAFGSQAPLVNAIVAATACAPSEARYVSGPAPILQSRLTNGLKTIVRVRVSSSGKAVSAVLYKTSGDSAFDRAVLTSAKKGAYAPEMRNCRPLAGMYVFEAMTS